jgi:pyrimidine nucleoside transport protein
LFLINQNFRRDTSILDAFSNGAKNGIDLVLNITANLISFVAFFAFADGIVKWVTFLLGFEDVGFEFILGKIFIPISWALGIEWEDCEAIGHVIGTKTIINELVAYKLLGQYKNSGEISVSRSSLNEIADAARLSHRQLRSSTIATYAICGFGNPSAMGIMIGSLSALAPEQRPAITKVAIRAVISGCIVSLMTASIAGLLMSDELIAKTLDHGVYQNKTSFLRAT